MHHDSSLKEQVSHGTQKNPISGLPFRTGKGTDYENGFFVERHWHRYMEIIYIIKGTYQFEINLEEFRLETGDICFLNGEDLHQITGLETITAHDVIIFDPKILEFSYMDEFSEQVIEPLLDRKHLLPHFLHPDHGHYAEVRSRLLPLLELAVKKPKRWYVPCKLGLIELLYFMQTCGLFLSADEALSPADRQKIERYKKMVSYMETNYPHTITLQDLGNVVSCNPQYMCRFFREITGTSPMQYLISLRVEHACSLLRRTEKSVLEISLDCGFENVSYFIRKFRQLKGCTPGEYRDSPG